MSDTPRFADTLERELAVAREQGRREGLEEAARLCAERAAEFSRYGNKPDRPYKIALFAKASALEEAANQIRARARGEDQRGVPPVGNVETSGSVAAVRERAPHQHAEVWVVTAYRWGARDNHSYVVGVYSNAKSAQDACEKEADDRGGKYGCEAVCAIVRDEWNHVEHPQRTHYVESPYVGAAGHGTHYCDDARLLASMKEYAAPEATKAAGQMPAMATSGNVSSEGPGSSLAGVTPLSDCGNQPDAASHSASAAPDWEEARRRVLAFDPSAVAFEGGGWIIHSNKIGGPLTRSEPTVAQAWLAAASQSVAGTSQCGSATPASAAPDETPPKGSIYYDPTEYWDAMQHWLQRQPIAGWQNLDSAIDAAIQREREQGKESHETNP